MAACGDKSDTVATQPSVTDSVATTDVVTTTTAATDTTPAITTTTTPPATTTTTTEPAQSAAIWAIPDGIEVAVASADGLHLLTGSDDRIISPEVFDDVVADPAGDGWFVQDFVEFNDSAAPRNIRRIGNDGSDELILTAEEGTYLNMHDVGVVNDHATLFYNVNLIRDVPQIEVPDELFAMDLVTGEQTKITDVGGWEAGINLRYGDEMLVGIYSSGASVEPWSVDLAGNVGFVDFEQVGLQVVYSDDPAAPWALTISAGGSRLSWVTRGLSQQLVIGSTEDAGNREFTLPNGPTQVNDIVDRDDYLVLTGVETPGALVDAETGGMLTLPVDGAAAAIGEWSEPPRWVIPNPVAEDVTDEIQALGPEWVDAPAPDEALAEALLGDDGGGECASLVRSFPNDRDFDNKIYVELRQFCDDSVAGSLYEVSVPLSAGGATRRTLCWRGVTTDGLCV